MQKFKGSLIAWSAAVAAILAWVAVSAFALSIRTEQSSSISNLSEFQSLAAQKDAALRLRALARGTENERAALENRTNIDFLQIANVIEGVGQSVGLKIDIVSVVPFTDPQQKAKTSSLNEADFVVETEGTFLALMQAASLFENLPLISSVQNLELERHLSSPPSKKGAATWRLTARIRVLTTYNI